MRWLLAALALLWSTGCSERFRVEEAERTHMAQEQPISKMWFDADGKRLFAQTGAVVRVWNVASATLERYVGPGFAGPGAPAGSVLVAPDLSRSVSFKGNVSGGTLSFFGEDGKSPASTAKIDRGISLVGLGVDDGVVAVAASRWRPGNEKDSARLHVWRAGAESPVLDVELAGWVWTSPDGRRTAHVRGGKELVLVDLASLAEERTITVADFKGLAFSGDGTTLRRRRRQRRSCCGAPTEARLR